MTHLVVIIRDKQQNRIGICRCFSRHIDIPGIFRLAVHDVGSDQPLDVALLSFVLLVPNQKETGLGLFVIAGGGAG